MPASNRTMINKLQTAINQHSGTILIDKVQFYSEEQERAITLYKIGVPTTENGRKKKDILFQTSSQIQVVLYLRDYWYSMRGKELPTDNEMWNKIKEEKDISFEAVKVIQNNVGG